MTTLKIRYFFLFGLLVFAGVLLVFDIDNDDLFMFGLSYTVLGFYPIIWMRHQLKKQGMTFSEIIRPQGTLNQLPRLIGIIVLLIIFSLGAFWLLNFALSYTFPSAVDFLLQEDELFPEQGLLFFFMVLYICIIGPVAEELIFRGLFLNRLSAKFKSPIAAIIIANGMFAILHMDPIGAFAFGVILSLIYFKTRNLWWPILLHILNNSFAIALMLFNIPDPAFLAYTNIDEVRRAWLPNTLFVILTAVLVIVLIRKKSKEVDWDEIRRAT
ncbi:CPBP family intramembrane glutamic endopeptidase [Pueribacillus theae]|uniref:CPBP family intramembrane glutamic endopeptidase n=1 Tax=Pueribacillus theae TaxID=2171751 RepID=UPI0014025ABD|nr:CPBP family intramembrane glutamic endopeptidase [Pueribacillus theae]